VRLLKTLLFETFPLDRLLSKFEVQIQGGKIVLVILVSMTRQYSFSSHDGMDEISYMGTSKSLKL
jgi:hypothetical protein